MAPLPYNAKRRKITFNPESNAAHRLSRSKVDLFFECPRCFYLNEILGIGRPSMPPFTLNVAVDHLLKKEFDIHRAKGSAHPLMKEYHVDAVPFNDPKIEEWRNNFRGVTRYHKETNLTFFGAVDDVWVNPQGELIVVDYKATSKAGKIDLSQGWGPQYKRQIEFYQWLLRGNDFRVSDTGYFVYANGIKDKEAFDKKLEFAIEIISHTGNDSWIEKTVTDIKACLMQKTLPESGETCEHCVYRESAGKAIRGLYGKKSDEKNDDEIKSGRLF